MFCPNFNSDVLLQPFHSDFLPSTSLGCWDITPQVTKLKDPGDAVVDLNAHQANPGKCAAYCFRFKKVGYGALSRGGRCHCIADYTSGGSSFGCNAQCGWSKMFWPGYLCGASATYTIASVYQDTRSKLTLQLEMTLQNLEEPQTRRLQIWWGVSTISITAAFNF